jgi:hypothetical protein
MKKLFSLLAVGAVLTVLLLPVTARSQVSINAAYVHQEHTFNYQNGTLDSLINHVDYMNGGMVGVSLNVPLIGEVGIAPGAYISIAQAKTLAADSNDHDFSTSTMTLKIPFYLNFKVALGEKTDLLIYGGPVFNVGISRLTNFRNVADQVDLHCDMGATLGAGVQFGRFRIYAGYNIDMIDRDDFSLANKESVKKAWEGSTLFVGLGVTLGSLDR